MVDFKGKYRIYIWAGLSALLIFILYIWFQNILSGEEGRIRKFILKGRRAVEAKDIITCAGMISINYSDKYGNDRRSLIYTAKEVFSYYKNIIVFIEKIEIKLDDSKNQATAEIEAEIVGQVTENKTESILEKGKGLFQVKLVKENKKWLVLELDFLDSLRIMGQEMS